MPDYRWDDQPPWPLSERYPDEPWLRGRDAWRSRADQFPMLNYADGLAWLDAIRRSPPARQPTVAPRVFVSHRQTDRDNALRIAWLVHDEASDYWLDVIDLDLTLNPQLKAFKAQFGRDMTPPERGILTAAIIEMALVNCSDVIAVMTSKSAGSQWIPYEYGRVKKRKLVSHNAACWHDHKSLTDSAMPEYLFLGWINRNESEIRRWCGSVVNPMQRAPGGKATGGWTGGPTIPLPTG